MTINTGALLLIIFIALLVPLIVQSMKRLNTMMREKWGWNLIPKILQPVLVAVIWAVVICFASKAGIFEAFGFALLCKWLDYLVTGLVVSLGVERLYSLVVSMREYQKKVVADELAEKKI